MPTLCNKITGNDPLSLANKSFTSQDSGVDSKSRHTRQYKCVNYWPRAAGIESWGFL